jgi:hypothetical protein
MLALLTIAIAIPVAGAEGEHLALYRLYVPVSELKGKESGDTTQLASGLISYLLSAREKCTVESLGTIPVMNGSYTFDTSAEVHFLVPQADKTFSLQTSERKIGLSFTGTIDQQNGKRIISYKLFNTFITKRIQLPGAPDISGGLPDMDTIHLESTRTLPPNVPLELALIPTMTPKTMVSSLYVVFSE